MQLRSDPGATRAAAPTPHRPLDTALADELARIDADGLRRTLTPRRRAPGGALVDADGCTLVDFASNDYLGLASDPRPAEAAADALAHDALGAGAARLISGDHAAHEQLERDLAAFKGTPRALLFSSGYAANVGALAALAGRDDVIYSDALNHASIVDGCRLSRATVRIFPHADVDALDAFLAADGGRFRRRWIAVEGVYSMDGDLFPLDRLVAVARAHGAYTFLDDAHATGVLGPDGRGSASHWGVGGTIDATVGTLGKALGTAGAFVAGSATLVELLLHRARSFVFTTGSPPALAAAASRALAIAAAEPWRRERLRTLARRLRDGLAALGIDVVGAPDGHIVPVVLGDAARTARVGAALLARGFVVGAIRPPTVPVGAARLRLGVSAAHDATQIDALLAALADVLAEDGAPVSEASHPASLGYAAR